MPTATDTDAKGCGAGVVTVTTDAVLERRAERIGIGDPRSVARLVVFCGAVPDFDGAVVRTNPGRT
jgi:hypothetical protein